MKKYILIWFLSLTLGNSFSQSLFQKCFGGGNEVGICMQQTSDAGFIITGLTFSYGAGSADVYLIKTNNIGDTLWTKTFGGSNFEQPYSVKQTIDNGFIISGITQSFGLTSYDIYLIKTDSIGNLIWSKTFGGSSVDRGYQVQQTTDLGYIVAGSYSLGSGYTNVYLIKTDANGDTLWTKTIGGPQSEYSASIQQCTDNGYILAGSTNSFGTFGVYLVRTDSVGNPLWSKIYNGGVAYSVQQTVDGGFILGGKSPPSFGAGFGDMYLIKTDSIGNILWTKTYGGAGIDEGYSVYQCTDTGYVLAGFSYSFVTDSIPHIYIVKTDYSGNLIWSNSYGRTTPVAQDFSVQQTIDGDYAFGGVNIGTPSASNIYLIKIDSSGFSNCGEGSAATIITTPSPVVSSPSTVTYSAITNVSNPPTQIYFGGVVTSPCTTVGVDEKEIQNTIFIYPNPATDRITINLKIELKDAQVEIFNELGVRVSKEKLFSGLSNEIHLVNLPPGIYFVKISNSEWIWTQKIIVQSK